MEPIHEGGEAEGQFAPADRDSSVMRVIGEEDLHGFTFEGLKRKLGIHSETLSRILARLEDQDFLAKTENGYVVTDRGRYLTGTSRTGHQTSGIVLLSTLLPAYQNGRVVSGLMGRWFGPLRWLGYSKEEDGMTLKWITEGGQDSGGCDLQPGRTGDRRKDHGWGGPFGGGGSFSPACRIYFETVRSGTSEAALPASRQSGRFR